MKTLTYKSAGVDIRRSDEFIAMISKFAEGIGGFGSIFDIDFRKYKNPVLVSSTDGVGTKLRLAFLLKRHNTVGIDLVAMNVNDIICMGARPIFFLDYIATGKIKKGVLFDVVSGIAEGCRQAGCRLIGGETAEMPDFYRSGEYDLAGFCVGIASKAEMFKSSSIKVGDSLVGLASNGPHSNGFSLIRKVFTSSKIKRYAGEILRPTRIYVKPILTLKRYIKSLAHITGGGFFGKLPRIVPGNKSFKIYKDSWSVPEIFRIIQHDGRIKTKEMFSTFNMGIGMVAVVSNGDSMDFIKRLKRFGIDAWIIGEVIPRKRHPLIFNF